MSSAVTIRDFRDSDEAMVLAIVRELQTHEARIYDRMKSPEAMGPWYITELLADIEKHKGRFLIAEVDGIVAGYATLLIEVWSEGERDEVDYMFSHVDDLAVKTSHRRLGIGRALLLECEQLARAAGQKWLRLGVLAANHEARAFYTTLGLEDRFLTLEKKLT